MSECDNDNKKNIRDRLKTIKENQRKNTINVKLNNNIPIEHHSAVSIAQDDIVTIAHLEKATILRCNGKNKGRLIRIESMTLGKSSMMNNVTHGEITKKILHILNYPDFRKNPQEYIDRFTRYANTFGKNSIYKIIYMVLKDILDKKKLMFTDSTYYLRDIEHSKIKDNSNDEINKCILDIKNNALDEKLYSKEILLLAKNKIKSWHESSDAPYKL